MSERFEKIPSSEQERILQAALEEFAKNGYRRASTNAIVKAAGIPKGTLFYYFGSKKNLFLYLVDGAVADYVSFVRAEKSEPPIELFERLLHREQVKLHFASSHPIIFRFFSKVFLDIPEEISEGLGSRFKEYRAASADDLTVGLDLTRFQEGVNVQDAIKMIHMLLEGIFTCYSPRLREAAPDEFDALIHEISVECRRYFNMIQKGIYR